LSNRKTNITISNATGVTTPKLIDDLTSYKAINKGWFQQMKDQNNIKINQTIDYAKASLSHTLSDDRQDTLDRSEFSIDPSQFINMKFMREGP